MNKLLLTSATSMLIALASASVCAEEPAETSASAEHHFYGTVKAVHTLGDDVGEEEGDPANGFGLALGYELTHGVALEFAYTRATGDIVFPNAQSESATYTTMGVNGVYSHPVGAGVAVVGKVGYVEESEEVAGESATENGVAYTVGVEYELNERIELAAEYEGSDIDSPRGSAVMAGVKVGF